MEVVKIIYLYHSQTSEGEEENLIYNSHNDDACILLFLYVIYLLILLYRDSTTKHIVQRCLHPTNNSVIQSKHVSSFKYNGPKFPDPYFVILGNIYEHFDTNMIMIICVY